ncbi:MAG: hypothetical protein DMG76_27220, partial [Acidobacteria bacterium]
RLKSRFLSIPFWRRPWRSGGNAPPIESLKIGSSLAGGIGAGNRAGDTRSYAGIFGQRPKNQGIEKRIGWHTFRRTYATLLRSVGTEFKVMQELMRHSSLRSTLDIYAQAITPAKQAAQAAVVSLMFPPGLSGAPVSDSAENVT